MDLIPSQRGCGRRQVLPVSQTTERRRSPPGTRESLQPKVHILDLIGSRKTHPLLPESGTLASHRFTVSLSPGPASGLAESCLALQVFYDV